jgi:hypothetical protein
MVFDPGAESWILVFDVAHCGIKRLPFRPSKCTRRRINTILGTPCGRQAGMALIINFFLIFSDK